MESHQLFVTTEDPNYLTSQYTPPSVPTKLFESRKSNFRDSPVSPFHFDCDSQDHPSSTESQPVKSSSCNSPLKTSSFHQRFNSSSRGDSRRDTLRPSTSKNFISKTSDYEVHYKYTLQELENALMDTDGETYPTMGESHQPQVQSQRSRSWNQHPHQVQSSSMGESHQPQVQIQRSRSWNQHPHQVQSSSSRSGNEGQSEKRHKIMEEHDLQLRFPPGNLKQLLFECARALSENRIDDFDKLVELARSKVSISGEPLERLGAYMIEGLVARKECSGPNIYKALRCKEPLGKDLLSYMHILYEICPYFKFGYMAANGAIAEACRNESRIHIIDFQIAQGTQWVTLLQALAARPGGPPSVRITGIDDPLSKYARGASLEAVGKRLSSLSEKFNIPVEFHPIPVFGPDVTREMLEVRPGEALAVNFPLQLHHIPDESVDVYNPRDGLLRMVKSLNPKVTTLVEQESNTNTTPFLTRFIETLEYYSAMFESIDVTMPRDRKERINVEQHCLAKDIVNVIACEGKDRVERHELLGKWKSRLTMARFRPYPLSSYVNSVIRALLKCYSEHYTLVEKDGAMLLGWKERMLISASAWN